MDAIYEKGAHFVLGTTEEMVSDSNSKFLGLFLDQINQANQENQKKSISEVIDDIWYQENGYQYYDSTGVLQTTDYFPMYAMGDQLQTLN
ncbi:MAG: hypothetical protein E7599_03015 [Ruminococcaceae bacterium]|nr:hypothetical protein [Oscillospiraceae bacterium]